MACMYAQILFNEMKINGNSVGLTCMSGFFFCNYEQIAIENLVLPVLDLQKWTAAYISNDTVTQRGPAGKLHTPVLSASRSSRGLLSFSSRLEHSLFNVWICFCWQIVIIPTVRVKPLHERSSEAVQSDTDLRHLWADACSFSAQQLLLLFHLWVRLGAQVVWYNLMAEDGHTLLRQFLIENTD